jgi:PAS domain S-box-containing protein
VFRPTPPRSLFGYVPLPLVLAVFSLFVLLLGLAVLAGIEYEKRVLGGLAASAPEVKWVELLKVLGLLLLLAAAGILTFATFQNYRTITKTFERSKTLMRNILDSVPTGVVTLDRSGRVSWLNGAAERLLGFRGATAVGRPIETMIEGAPDLVGWVRSVLAGEERRDEADFSLTRGTERRFMLRVWASDLKGAPGGPEGLVILLRDITEMNRLEFQLRRSDKLAALGTLAAGVAHEVKNPLHALNLNLHLLAQELASLGRSDQTVKGYLEILRSEIQRLHRIIDNFLRFSKPSIPEVRPLDLNALVERVLSLVAFEAADRGVTIETELDPALATAPGDEGQLSQVLLNLTINALQAMPSGGTLTVRTRLQDDLAEVEVRDTGEGVPAEHLPHLFDPYFTTRPGGVGLGLAITHRIVEGHHGMIDVESQVGKGTVVVVRLPRQGVPILPAWER